MECKNNYQSEEEFTENFGKEDTTDNCNGCMYLEYKDGIILCKKFN